MNEKSDRPLWTAIIAIIIYVVLMSAAENFSAAIGIESVVTAPVAIALSAAAVVYLLRSGDCTRLGFRSMKGLNMRALIYCLPFVAIATINLWNGARIANTAAEVALYIVSMLCVAFLEEFIFRGLLFHALAQKHLQQGIVISSITFGLGHIVNLLNGAELVPTLLQLIYAIAIGFAFTLFVYRSGNIWPCVICHAVVNVLALFGVPGSLLSQIVQSAMMTLIAGGYAVYLYRTAPAVEKK